MVVVVVVVAVVMLTATGTFDPLLGAIIGLGGGVGSCGFGTPCTGWGGAGRLGFGARAGGVTVLAKLG